jgi:hypothetical protein
MIVFGIANMAYFTHIVHRTIIIVQNLFDMISQLS